MRIIATSRQALPINWYIIITMVPHGAMFGFLSLITLKDYQQLKCFSINHCTQVELISFGVCFIILIIIPISIIKSLFRIFVGTKCLPLLALPTHWMSFKMAGMSMVLLPWITGALEIHSKSLATLILVALPPGQSQKQMEQLFLTLDLQVYSKHCIILLHHQRTQASLHLI